jgi:pimeloyl-ACP methyl ester carboxylesterase
VAVWAKLDAGAPVRVVCVHGGLDRAGSFQRLARRLDFAEVIAYDRRGYQGSRALGPTKLEGHLDDLEAVLDATDDGRPTVVFGHSFGGLVAYGVAARRHDIDLVIAYEPPLPWIRAQGAATLPTTRDPNDAAVGFFREMVSSEGWERLSELERASRQADGQALLNDLDDISSGREFFSLSDITTPCVFAYGDSGLREHYETLANAASIALPSLNVVEVPGASHGAHLASPEKLAALLCNLWRETCA